MKIITVSREFGSGGRELGKRLAQLLAFEYYDREIISFIAEKKGLDEGFVERMLDGQARQNVPLTFRRSFLGGAALQTPQPRLLLEQKSVIEGIAKQGRDCVIVGRNADILLKAYRPFNIFVCADMQMKIRRCAERAGEGENLSPKQIKQNIRRIDKNRRYTREILTQDEWGRRGAYHLIVNTTDWDIKELTPAVAEFAMRWFGRSK